MRIALVTNLYPPIQTGTAYYTKALAHAMAGRGHDVMVVTCRAGGETVDTVHDGVRVVRLPALRLPPNRLMQNFDDFKVTARPGVIRRLTDLLRGHGPDVVQQCGHLLDLTYVTPRAAAHLGVPSACSIHALIHLPGRPLLDRLARTVDRALVGPAGLHRYDAIYALDRTMEEYVRERYRPKRVESIPWGIDFDFDRFERNPPAGGPLRLVSLGHVTEQRSRATLLRAVALLRDEGVPVELRIIGKECTLGTRRLSQELGLDQIVTLTGELPRDAAMDEVSRADVQANWITNPGVGSAAMESMAMGVPTMLWADPDQLSFARLEHLDNALLVDPQNPREIADVLLTLAADRELVNGIGKRARLTAADSFGWDATAERMEALYEQLAGQ